MTLYKRQSAYLNDVRRVDGYAGNAYLALGYATRVGKINTIGVLTCTEELGGVVSSVAVYNSDVFAIVGRDLVHLDADLVVVETIEDAVDVFDSEVSAEGGFVIHRQRDGAMMRPISNLTTEIPVCFKHDVGSIGYDGDWICYSENGSEASYVEAQRISAQAPVGVVYFGDTPYLPVFGVPIADVVNPPAFSDLPSMQDFNDTIADTYLDTISTVMSQLLNGSPPPPDAWGLGWTGDYYNIRQIVPFQNIYATVGGGFDDVNLDLRITQAVPDDLYINTFDTAFDMEVYASAGLEDLPDGEVNAEFSIPGVGTVTLSTKELNAQVWADQPGWSCLNLGDQAYFKANSFTQVGSQTGFSTPSEISVHVWTNTHTDNAAVACTSVALHTRKPSSWLAYDDGWSIASPVTSWAPGEPIERYGYAVKSDGTTLWYTTATPGDAVSDSYELVTLRDEWRARATPFNVSIENAKDARGAVSLSGGGNRVYTVTDGVVTYEELEYEPHALLAYTETTTDPSTKWGWQSGDMKLSIYSQGRYTVEA